jgi:DNA-binding transcriptional regulator YiaG
MRFRLDGEKPKKPRIYEVCGLPGVHLLNGYNVIRHEGEEHVSVTDVDGLHRAIARHIAFTRKVLTPAEVRFIRKTLDLTQSGLAAKLGVNVQSVARWEKGQCEMPGTADKLLRVVFLAQNMREDDMHAMLGLIKALDELDQLDEARPAQGTFKLEDTWTEASLVEAA